MVERSEEPKTRVEVERLQAAVARRLGLDEVAPVKIDRFTVLERIGQGGMGDVYAVYDEQLDRRVALKLIKGDQRPDLQARLQREAQALAKLSHPNVVPVFEVGEHNAEAFIVMEFVRGQTLAEWARTQAPSVDEILDKYIQAGRGLAAAHGAQLVHRDFKPDNAIVGESGRVRVLDFGLARKPDDTKPSPTGPGAEDTRSSSAFTTPLTATGVLVGTPLYMAPEQFRGDATDHRSDQFSFCVALWEALVGERPFAGETRDTLGENVLEGRLRDAKLPRALRPILERGLNTDASARWPSMDTLLTALAQQRARPRRWWVGAGAIALLAAIGAAWAASRRQPCDDAARHLEGVWDDARRAPVEHAIVGTDLPYARPVWERTSVGLDRYADAWVAMHTETCEATTVHGEQSAEILDLRMGCLRRANVTFAAVVDVLADADRDVVDHAHELVDGLGDLGRCGDVDALRADGDPPGEDEAARVDAARADLAAARAAADSKRYTEARAKVDEARQTASDVQYEPLHIEIDLADGHALHRLGKYDEAELAFASALESATRRLQRPAMLQASTELLRIVGFRLRRTEEATQRYAMLAKTLAVGDPVAEARYLSAHGYILMEGWKYAEAETDFRRALQLREESLGPAHPDVAEARRNLSWPLHESKQFDEAETELRAALRSLSEALGAEHPAVIGARLSLGSLLKDRGELDDAAAEYRKALAWQLDVLGPAHPQVAASHTGLAIVLGMQGDNAGAEVAFKAALDVTERAHGPEHPEVAFALDNLAVVLLHQRKYAAAEVHGRRAVELWLKTLGAEHPDVAFSRSNLGLILGREGKGTESVAEHRAALAIFEKELGPEHPDVAMERDNLAVALLKAQQVQEAVKLAELAWARRQKDDIPRFDQAEGAQVLAAALWDAGGAENRSRARALAKRALPAYLDAPEFHAETTRWLRDRAGNQD